MDESRREMAEPPLQMVKFVRLFRTCRWLIRGGCIRSSRVYGEIAIVGVFYTRGRYNDTISWQHQMLR